MGEDSVVSDFLRMDSSGDKRCNGLVVMRYVLFQAEEEERESSLFIGRSIVCVPGSGAVSLGS